jgi:hypothetical protein
MDIITITVVALSVASSEETLVVTNILETLDTLEILVLDTVAVTVPLEEINTLEENLVGIPVVVINTLGTLVVHLVGMEEIPVVINTTRRCIHCIDGMIDKITIIQTLLCLEIHISGATFAYNLRNDWVVEKYQFYFLVNSSLIAWLDLRYVLT